MPGLPVPLRSMSICRYAVGSKRFDELNLLLHVAVAGGALCGLVAFALMAVVVYVPVLAAAVLDPSAVSNKALIDGGCALIPTTEQLLENANMYWRAHHGLVVPQVYLEWAVRLPRRDG